MKLGLAGVAIIAALDLAACRQPTQHQVRGVETAQTAPPRPRPPPPPPPFTREDAAAAFATLRSAPDHGFPAQRFPADDIESLFNSAVPAEHAEGERRLRAAVLDYARAQHGLSIPTGALPRAWNQRPSAYDAEAELNAALRGGDLRAWLDGLPPQTPAYKALQAAYVAARENRPDAGRAKVRTTDLQIGEQDDRTEALRKRLALEEPRLAAVDPEAPVDEELVAAVRSYQTNHDLEETGALDAATAERLNAPTVGKAAKLRVNMERLRWLPRPEPARRIDVNIAAAEMDYYEDGEVATHMLAVSGKPGDETPMVSSTIDSIVFNPPWNVPPDIARREILRKGSGYLRSHHFVWRGGRLVQQPGPKAALGRVKFDFPNVYAVYLHDTPTRSTFSQSRRTASHGCVRLERAVELARTVVEEEPGSSVERVDRLLASGKTSRLKLSRPIPVRLTYLTAAPRGDTIAYLPDVYGWDAKLLALLDRYQSPKSSR